MKVRPAFASAGALSVILALAACTTPPPPDVEAPRTVAINTFGSVTSLNARTSTGRTTANADLGYLTGTGFGYHDPQGRFIEDTSFGTAKLVSESPFIVRYTLAKGLNWSDGTPIGAADLMLSWAAGSRALDSAPDAVGFDSIPGGALDATVLTPTVVDDGRGIEVTFEHPVAAWRTAITATVPAHVAATEALGVRDPGDGADAVLAAITDDDRGALAALSQFWNSGYQLAETPPDPALLVAAGPYVVRGFDASGVDLIANPEYRGDRRPGIDSLRLTSLPDSAGAVAGITAGTLDVARIGVLGDIQSAAQLPGVGTSLGPSSRYELLELNATAPLHPVLTEDAFRRALLSTVPRQAIAEQVLSGVEAEPATLDSWTIDPGSPDYVEAVDANGSRAVTAADPGAAAALLVGLPTPLEVCVLFDPANARRVTTFGLIRDAAATIGIAVTDCSRPDWQAAIGTPGAYDAVLDSWDRLPLTDPGALDYLGSDETRPLPLESAPEAASGALADVNATTDDAERATHLTALDTELWASARGMPLYSLPAGLSVSSRLAGVELHPGIRSALWDAWAWTGVDAGADGDDAGAN